MGVFRSSGSFGVGVFTGDGLGNYRRPKKATAKPAVGDLDGDRPQGHDHSKRFFQPD